VGEFGDNKGGQPEFARTPNGNYTIIGTMTIDDFNQVFNYQLPASGEYNTIAGFIAEKTGKILNPGETYQYENLRFELVKKIRQKMVQFRIYSNKNDLAEVSKE
jgi:magnesium and cobalt exporter, CNNM family